jgi:hypothetical protein
VKKTLSFFGLFLLILIGAISLFVINDPAYARELAGAAPGDTAAPPPRQVAQAKAPEAPAAPAGEKPAEAAGQKEFDRKASAGQKASERPPSREEFEKQRAKDIPSVTVSRAARDVGPVEEPNNLDAPPAELYPFEITRRTYPDANSITVEIAVKNASGMHWKTAYITLRSPKVERGHRFEIQDWRIDEIVGLEYTFPREQLDDRIRYLRITNVSGNQRESALADLLSANRRKLVDQTGNVNVRDARRAGDTLTAPGLLSYVSNAQMPFTGIRVLASENTGKPKKFLEINISPDLQIPADPAQQVRETSEERREVAGLINDFHSAALDVQNAVQEFGNAIGSQPYNEAIAGPAIQPLEELRRAIARFNTTGYELATRIQRSNDSEVKEIRALVNDYSRKISGQVQSLEEQVQTVDERFVLDNSGA